MARVFVTGSADGLGLAVGQRLIDAGHEVVLHARNEQRAAATREAAPGAADVLVGEVSEEAQVRALAEAANASGRFDAVVHNVAVGGSAERERTGDGHSLLFAVNVVAPYLLTALMRKPGRLVYLSSGAHYGSKPDLSDTDSTRYGGSKLLDSALAAGVARRWPDVRSNSVDPGWIRTRMGGSSAPGDLDQGSATQIWLATSDDPDATVTGRYFKDSAEQTPDPQVVDTGFQDELLTFLARETGVDLPD